MRTPHAAQTLERRRLLAATALLLLPGVVSAQAILGTLPQDMSPWGMFVAADWVVKAVIIGLTCASVLTWTVLVAKSLELRNATRAQRKALAAIERSRTLDEAVRHPDASQSPLLAAATSELAMSAGAFDDAEGLKERVVSHFDQLQSALGRRMNRGTSVLATVGATAPFIGLFGTVWGIMNSFIGIAEKQTTNLAVVAPGIAEALLATAIGLFAAIPAVVIYNHFARQIAAYRALVADTAAAILRLVSRDISRGVAGKPVLRAVGD